MPRIRFPSGEFRDIPVGTPQSYIDNLVSAYEQYGSLAAVDQWIRLDALREDPGFLALPRLERHKVFNSFIKQSPEFWNYESMTPDRRRIFRDHIVEVPGANEQDTYDYWNTPIHFKDEVGQATDGVIAEFVNAFQRSAPQVTASVISGFANLAASGADAMTPETEQYLGPLNDPERRHRAAAQMTDNPAEPGKLDQLAALARAMQTDAEIGAETLAPAPKVGSFGEVHGWDSFAMYVAKLAGEQAPILATIAGLSAIPGLAAGGAGVLGALGVGSAAGITAASTAASVGTGIAMATGAALETGSIISDLERQGLSTEESRNTAALYGVLAGALEALPIAAFLKRQPAAGRLFKNALVDRLANGAIQATEEGFTEFLQTIVEQTAVDVVHANRGEFEKISWMTPEGRRSMWDEATEAMIAGAVLGGGMGTMGRTGQAPTEAPPAPSAEPQPGTAPETGQPATAIPTAAGVLGDTFAVEPRPPGPTGPARPADRPITDREMALELERQGAGYMAGQQPEAAGLPPEMAETPFAQRLANIRDAFEQRRQQGLPLEEPAAPVDLTQLPYEELLRQQGPDGNTSLEALREVQRRVRAVQAGETLAPGLLPAEEEEVAAPTEQPNFAEMPYEELVQQRDERGGIVPGAMEELMRRGAAQEDEAVPRETAAAVDEIVDEDLINEAAANPEDILNILARRMGITDDMIDQAVGPGGRQRLLDQALRRVEEITGQEVPEEIRGQQGEGELLPPEEPGVTVPINREAERLVNDDNLPEDVRNELARQIIDAQFPEVPGQERLRRDFERVFRSLTPTTMIQAAITHAIESGRWEEIQAAATTEASKKTLWNMLIGQTIQTMSAGQVSLPQNFNVPMPAPTVIEGQATRVEEEQGQLPATTQQGEAVRGVIVEGQEAAEVAAEAAGGEGNVADLRQSVEQGKEAVETFQKYLKDATRKSAVALKEEGLIGVNTPYQYKKDYIKDLKEELKGAKETLASDEENLAIAERAEAEAAAQRRAEEEAAAAAPAEQTEAEVQPEQGELPWNPRRRALSELEKSRVLNFFLGLGADLESEGKTPVQIAMLEDRDDAIDIYFESEDGEDFSIIIDKDNEYYDAIRQHFQPGGVTVEGNTAQVEGRQQQNIRALEPNQITAVNFLVEFDEHGTPIPEGFKPIQLRRVADGIEVLYQVPGREIDEGVLKLLVPFEDIRYSQLSELLDTGEIQRPLTVTYDNIWNDEGDIDADIDVLSPEWRREEPVTLSHMRSALKGWAVEKAQSGGYVFTIPGVKHKLHFRWTDDMWSTITAGREEKDVIEEIARKYNKTFEEIEKLVRDGIINSRLHGAYSDTISGLHIITLNKPTAGPESMFHEAFHFAMEHFFNPDQRAAILKEFGTEENAAKVYGRLAAAKFAEYEGKTLNAGERALKWLWEQAKKLARAAVGNDVTIAQNLLEDLYKGRIWQQPWLNKILDERVDPHGWVRVDPKGVISKIAADWRDSLNFDAKIHDQLSSGMTFAAIKKLYQDGLPTSIQGRMYSKLTQVVRDVQQKKWKKPLEFLEEDENGKYKGWITKQAGIKADEIKWTGLAEFVKMHVEQNIPLLKKDVLDFLKNNGFRMTEVVRGENGRPTIHSHRWALRQIGDADTVSVDESNFYENADEDNIEAVLAYPNGWEIGIVAHGGGFEVAWDNMAEVFQTRKEAEIALAQICAEVGTIAVDRRLRFDRQDEAFAESMLNFFEQMIGEDPTVQSWRDVGIVAELYDQNAPLQTEELDRGFNQLSRLADLPTLEAKARELLKHGYIYETYAQEMLDGRLDEYKVEEGFGAGDLQYHQPRWQLPGWNKKSARELLMRLPESFAGRFSSGHWGGMKNIIAHMRFNERIDRDGTKVLFIEEIQSDLHQLGATIGYEGEPYPIIKRYEKLVEQYPELAEWTGDWRDVEYHHLLRVGVPSEIAKNYIKVKRKTIGFDQPMQAPFKGNAWAELMLKRAMIWAAENGYDRVAWTTGTQQAMRWNTGDMIEHIGWAPMTETFDQIPEKYRAEAALVPDSVVKLVTLQMRTSFRNKITLWVDEDGIVVESNHPITKGEPLSAVIGDQYTAETYTSEKGEVKPTDLMIGGEGFKNLYDKQFRNIAKKLLKPYKGEVKIFDFELEEQERQQRPGFSVYNTETGDVFATYLYEDMAKSKAFMMNRRAEGGHSNWSTKPYDPSDDIEWHKQMGFDIPEDLKMEILGHGMTAFHAELNDPKPVITDPNPVVDFAPNTGSGGDGNMQDPAMVPTRQMVKQWLREHVMRKFFDKLAPVRWLQEKLTALGIQIDESLDAYLKARNFSGRAGALTNWLEQKFFQPLIDKIAELDIDLRTFDEYRMALRSLELNPHLYRMHVVIPKAALKKVIETAKRTGLHKGHIVIVPQMPNLKGRILSVHGETVTIEYTDPDSLEKETVEAHKDHVLRNTIAEAEAKLKEIDEMVENHTVPHAGLTSPVARQMLRHFRDVGLVKFEGEPKNATKYSGPLEEVGKLFDNLVRWKEDTLVKSGLITEEEMDAWKKVGKRYAPMRGKQVPDILDFLLGGDLPPLPDVEPHGAMWHRVVDTLAKAAGHTGEVFTPNIGKGYNPGARKAARRALGRHSVPAHSPTVELFSDALELAIRAERNRVAKTVWNLFKSMSGLEDEHGRPLIILDDPPKKLVFDEKTKGVKEVVDNLALNKANVYDVWIDGVHHYARSNSTDMAGVFSVLNNVGPESAPKVLRSFAQINRYIAKMATSRNPAFAIPNLVRDFLTAGIRLQSDPEFKKLGTKVLKNIPKNIKILAKYARLETKGRLDEMDPEVRKRIEAFKLAGGETAFWMIPRLEAHAKNVRKQIDIAAKRNSRIFRGTRHLLDFLEDYNGALEATARFSVFEAALAKGASMDKAARLAREITVDFTMQGEFAGWMGSLWVFSNASLQGTRMIYETLWKNKQARKTWLPALVALGATQALVGRAMGGDDPEDEVPYWDKITDYEKSRNMIFMLPMLGDGFRLKVPLPWGFNVATMIGQTLMDVFMGGKTATQGAAAIVSSGFSAFNPIGDNDLRELAGWYQMAAPSWLDPTTDIVLNRTFWGGPIMPDSAAFKKSEQYGIPQKDHTRYFSSASEFSKWGTRGLYKLTGIDISPETVDYTISAWAGGLGDTVQKSINLIPAAAMRRKLASHELPVLRSFFATESYFYAPQAYRANMAHYWEKYEHLRELQRENSPEAGAYQAQWSHILALKPQVKAFEDQVKKLRDMGVTQDDSRMQRLFKRFNLMYDRVEANDRRKKKAKVSIMK